MTTFREIEEDVVRQLVIDLGDMSLANLSVPLSGTTAGTTTTIVDTKLGRGTRDANAYDGRALLITEFSSGGPTIRSIAQVTTAGFNGTSTLTFAPALDNASDSGQNYIMYPLGVGPDKVFEAIQRALRMGEAPHIVIPSLVQNSMFDQQNDNVATDPPDLWTEIGALTSMVVNNGDVNPNVPFGNYLSLSAASTDEGIESAPFSVSESEVLLVSVLASGGASDGIVKADLRISGGASIQSKTLSIQSADAFGFYEIRFTATIASGTEAAVLRITSNTADIFSIGTPIVVQSQKGRLMHLPHGLYREEQITGWFRVPKGATSNDTDTFIPYSNGLEPIDKPRSMMRFDVTRAGVTNRWDEGASSLGQANSVPISPIYMPITCTNDPVGFKYMRSFEEATTDRTATSDNATEIAADREWIVAEALANLSIPGWRRKANARARIMGYGTDPGILITPNSSVAV